MQGILLYGIVCRLRGQQGTRCIGIMIAAAVGQTTATHVKVSGNVEALWRIGVVWVGGDQTDTVLPITRYHTYLPLKYHIFHRYIPWDFSLEIDASAGRRNSNEPLGVQQRAPTPTEWLQKCAGNLRKILYSAEIKCSNKSNTPLTPGTQ